MADRMDIPYAQANGRDLRLDVYEADPQHDQRTAVLLVHGGGWKRGDRKMLAAHAALLAAQGFTAVACEYRLLGESPWPGCSTTSARRSRGCATTPTSWGSSPARSRCRATARAAT